MICKECAENGLKSRVYIEASTTTTMGMEVFYDEAGVFHYHDPNKTVQPYRCTNGHNFRVIKTIGCSGCGTNNEEKYERVK